MTNMSSTPIPSSRKGRMGWMGPKNRPTCAHSPYDARMEAATTLKVPRFSVNVHSKHLLKDNKTFVHSRNLLTENSLQSILSARPTRDARGRYSDPSFRRHKRKSSRSHRTESACFGRVIPAKSVPRSRGLSGTPRCGLTH